MRRSILYLLLIPALFIACASKPAAIEEKPPADTGAAVEPAAAEQENIHGAVSREVYDNTLAEVRLFIDGLNKTISAKNYTGWRDALSDEYFGKISSPEFLAEASEQPSLKTRKIVLRSANDYFGQVVVPSRANSRVDEIEFEDDNRVKAYFVETRNVKDANNTTRTETRRLRLYDLIKVDDKWKIVN